MTDICLLVPFLFSEHWPSTVPVSGDGVDPGSALARNKKRKQNYG